jgi:hypothetical protein
MAGLTLSLDQYTMMLEGHQYTQCIKDDFAGAFQSAAKLCPHPQWIFLKQLENTYFLYTFTVLM